MKKIKFISMLMMILCFSVSSCKKDEDASPALLLGTWECYYDSLVPDGNYDYPYLIIENDYWYFCTTPSTIKWGERYKYVYNQSSKTVQAQQIYKDNTVSEEIYTWPILQYSSSELWLLINGDETVKYRKL